MKRFVFALLAAAIMTPAFAPGAAVAQTNVPQAQPAPLPPALQAAVQSGNPAAVTAALNTLSAGDPQRLASLSLSVVAAAERMLNANPQAAVRIAAVALEAVRTDRVAQAAVSQTQSIVTIAARIFISPPAQTALPDAVAQLASTAVQVATKLNNPVLTATVASQAVSTAEKILRVDPAAAVDLASTAVQAVKQVAVSQAAPAQTMETVVTSARVILSPEAQQAAPVQVAALSVAIVSVVTNPTVYQASPTSALSVMQSAYTAASSQAVATASPGTVQTVRSELTQAAQTVALNQTNSTNASSINTILATTTTTTTTTTATTNTVTSPAEENKIVNASPS